MEAILVKTYMWEYDNGANVKPEPNDNADAILEWERNDRNIHGKDIYLQGKIRIILSILPNELKQVKNCQTPKDMWIRLCEIYQSQGTTCKARSLKRLTLHEMAENGDVQEHLEEFFDTIGDMDIVIHPD